LFLLGKTVSFIMEGVPDDVIAAILQQTDNETFLRVVPFVSRSWKAAWDTEIPWMTRYSEHPEISARAQTLGSWRIAAQATLKEQALERQAYRLKHADAMASSER
jgi:hypothetical protein